MGRKMVPKRGRKMVPKMGRKMVPWPKTVPPNGIAIWAVTSCPTKGFHTGGGGQMVPKTGPKMVPKTGPKMVPQMAPKTVPKMGTTSGLKLVPTSAKYGAILAHELMFRGWQN